MKYLYNFISYLFHPFLIPVYFVLILLLKPIYPLHFYQLNHKILLLTLTFVHAFILPTLIFLFLYYNSKIETLKLPTAKSRKLPYKLVSIIYFITAIVYFFNNNIPNILSLVFVIASFNILILTLLLNKSKLSAHITGISGLIASFIYFDAVMGLADFSSEIIGAIIILGITASSRLGLNAHKTSEIYLAVVLCLISNFILLFFTSDWFLL